jgi:tetratricopeptide (TPR) repeat protein
MDGHTGRQVCFVDMPFGKKSDPRSGVEIDFDPIYEKAIRPGIEAAGLVAVRGDQELTGGIIHTAMFARLLLSEFVIADLTTANPNVFYELGVRHSAKPYTTIPIFSTVSELPFDVSLVRAIPYELVSGALTPEAADKLRDELHRRIETALRGPVTRDSPLFQLFERFPGIEMSHEVTDVFRDRVEYSERFRERLRGARAEGAESLRAVQAELGDIAATERGVLIDLFLSYRSVEAFDEMIELAGQLPPDVRDTVVVQQQLAFALNRRKGPGDVDAAIDILERIEKNYGASAETLGLLGRIFKDRYREARDAGRTLQARGHLDRAIAAYTRGFETEPADFYPGINAITLNYEKGTEEAIAAAERLAPLVAFAAARRGGAQAQDYWTLATVLELAVINRDDALIAEVLPGVLVAANESFMRPTTAGNLNMVLDQRRGQEDTSTLEDVIAELTAP